MAQYKAIDPKAEVNGQTVLSIVDGMLSMKEIGIKALADKGIKDPKPDEWYNQQAWLDAFCEIEKKMGAASLLLIGMQIPKKANWPPSVNSIETALPSIDVAYHMNHRIDGVPLFDPASGTMKEGIGHYKAEKIGEKAIKMICDNPYPCEFDKGIIESAANKFKAPGSKVDVLHDDSQPCRRKGGDTCTYIVTW